jgi:hypothetical protein
VRVAGHLPHDLPYQRDPTGVSGELARTNLRSAPSGDGRVEKEDGESGRDGEGEDQARRAALRGHAEGLSGDSGIEIKAWATSGSPRAC